MLNQIDRIEIAKWVAESQRPFSIVEDDGFKTLMKTGRPDYYIPSRYTVARDVKQVFKKTRKRIAKMLQVCQLKEAEKILIRNFQEYDGSLSFGIDAWTSPNNKAYVAVTVHFEHDGEPMCLLLDIVQVAKSHSGFNLARAFADLLEEFGISKKVSFTVYSRNTSKYLLLPDP